MFSYKINYTNIFFIFLVYITMGCANLAYLTRNPFRFFECFPNFSRTLPPNDSRFLTEIFRVLVELFSIFQECSRKSFVLFPSFPEIFRVFSDFSRMLPKTSTYFRNIFSTYDSMDLYPFPNRALRLSHR